ncbi:DVUA0089 family protein [Peribacillus sp. SCS-26]|uniref:DVUA0089 family protein n=1 Tax=Paraperibacillus marinus TaxID=3115295 RepID=UPI00390587BB
MSRLKKATYLFTALLLAISLLYSKSSSVQASSAIPLSFDTSVTGNITDANDEQMYEITLSKAGRISVDLSSYLTEVYLDLYDSEQDKVWSTQNIYTGKPENPKKWTGSEDLEAGTYYIKLSQYSDYSGSYSIKINYQAAGNNELEPNNGSEQAQPLTFNTQTVKGFICWNDDTDYYKVTLPAAGRITVDLSSYLSEVYLDLYDSEQEKVWSTQNIYTGKPEDPKKWTSYEDLEAGTYYIKLSQYSDYTGSYSLKVNYKAAGNNEKEPNNGSERAQPLTFNTQTVKGFISWNDDTDYYKVTLPKAGRITVDVSSYLNEVYLDLYDSEQNKVWSTQSIYTGKPEDPKRWTTYEDLEAGTYYIKLSQYSDYTGSYSLKVNYQAAGNNEIEPNNGSERAQPLTLNKQTVNGFISWNDDADYYKITVPKSGRLYINLSSYMNEVYLDLYDSRQNKVWYTQYIYEGKPGNPKKWSGWDDLKPGTYYIKISQGSSYTGKYSLSVKFPSILPASPAVNAVSNTGKVISGKGLANSTVKVKISTKTYTGKTDKKGYFRINIPAQKAGTKIYVTLTDSHQNTSSTKTITVIDRIPPKSPSVSTVTSKSKSISGYTEPNAIVYAYAGSKKIGSAKAGKSGYYIIKIQNQKAKSSIKVYAKDAAGNTSGTKTIKVK